jgi:hypothetical protein
MVLGGIVIALAAILLIWVIVHDARGFGQTEIFEATQSSFIYDGVVFKVIHSIEKINAVDEVPVTRETLSFEIDPSHPHEFVIQPRSFFENDSRGFKVVYEPGLKADYQVRSSTPDLMKQFFADGRLASDLNTYAHAFLFKQRKLTVQFIAGRFTATMEKSGKHHDSTDRLSETAKLFYEKIKRPGNQ